MASTLTRKPRTLTRLLVAVAAAGATAAVLLGTAQAQTNPYCGYPYYNAYYCSYYPYYYYRGLQSYYAPSYTWPSYGWYGTNIEAYAPPPAYYNYYNYAPTPFHDFEIPFAAGYGFGDFGDHHHRHEHFRGEHHDVAHTGGSHGGTAHAGSLGDGNAIAVLHALGFGGGHAAPATQAGASHAGASHVAAPPAGGVGAGNAIAALHALGSSASGHGGGGGGHGHH